MKTYLQEKLTTDQMAVVNGESNVYVKSSDPVGAIDDVTINNTSIVESRIAKIIYETGLGSDSSNAATVTAIRSFVNSSINAIAAYYITSNAQGDPFATKAALTGAVAYYYAGSTRVPTKNDYAIVAADETHSNMSARYVYTESGGVGQWAFQYTFNMQFTDAQVSALNSGINSAKVALYDAHLASTSNPHNVTKSQVGLGNVPNVTTNNQTPTFSEASTRANINSGETLATLFGKIKKWFSSLGTMAFETATNYVATTRKVNNKALSSDITLTQDDVSDGTTYKRVTATEKSTWNSKQDALGYTPYNATNPSGYQTAAQVTAYVNTRMGSDENGVWIDV